MSGELPPNFTPEETTQQEWIPLPPDASATEIPASSLIPAAPVVAAQPVTTGENNMQWLTLLFAILQAVPTIAQGVVTIKADCDLGDKKKAAQDSLSTLTSAALAVVPDDQKELATMAAGAAQGTMDAVVTALHTTQQTAAQTPAPAASLPAAA